MSVFSATAFSRFRRETEEYESKRQINTKKVIEREMKQLGTDKPEFISFLMEELLVASTRFPRKDSLEIQV